MLTGASTSIAVSDIHRVNLKELRLKYFVPLVSLLSTVPRRSVIDGRFGVFSFQFSDSIDDHAVEEQKFVLPVHGARESTNSSV